MTLTPFLYLLVLGLQHGLKLALAGLLLGLGVLPALGHLAQGLGVGLLQRDAGAGLRGNQLVQLQLLLLLRYLPRLQHTGGGVRVHSGVEA